MNRHARYIIASCHVDTARKEDPGVEYFVIDRSRDVVMLRTQSFGFADRVKRALNDV